MKDNNYVKAWVTQKFLNEVLKSYTSRMKEIEAKKNGKRKIRVTKRIVCNSIMDDMRRNNLL